MLHVKQMRWLRSMLSGIMRQSQAGANSSAKKKAPGAHPKPFDPNANPIRVIVDVLWHDNSRAVLKGPVTSQALKTMVV